VPLDKLYVLARIPAIKNYISYHEKDESKENIVILVIDKFSTLRRF